ncbi:MAG: Crp/Fnr family transcriptional regulator [Methylobacteriaceae bacterium]|nr:Crp/Fnr family transcriptional regulator [Methylobacteriaceae bacterium]
MNKPIWPSGNRLLASLPHAALGRCMAELEQVTLTTGQFLERAGSELSEIVLVESGVLSILAEAAGVSVEVGMIGRDGMTGLPAVFGCLRSSQSIVVQIAGSGLRITPARFKGLCERNPELGALALRYCHAQVAQISHGGLANARRTVTERLARWLLMCADRASEVEFAVTHEMLSGALGVRRPGVTVATHILEGEGAIKARRGRITLIDRDRLESMANGCYGSPEREYDRLFVPPSLASSTPRSYVH